MQEDEDTCKYMYGHTNICVDVCQLTVETNHTKAMFKELGMLLCHV